MNKAALFCAALGLLALVAAVPYPLDASWFANRWTLSEWLTTLTEFKETGGSIVWQRGAIFRPRSVADILQDPDFVWCTQLEHCTDKATSDVAALGGKIYQFYSYQNDEDYDPKSLLKCPFDLMINSSRIYYRLIVPHGTYTPNWDCKISRGMELDVIFTEFAGTDPHSLLIKAADQLGMEVHLPMPQVPDDTLYWPAYYEFTRRVLDSYSAKYDSSSSYKGVYQTNEACLGAWYQQIAKANQVISAMIHSHNKQFVISPYIDLNRAQVAVTVADHKEGFKAMARTGADIIAVQEGRGCAKGCYWWTWQANQTVISVDPVLDQVYNYIAPNWNGGHTFLDMFTASNQQVFTAFEEAVEELKSEGVKVDLWLNLEAFEYLRDYPCLPVDKMGNGMAELLDRTSKQRIDWGLTVAGAHVSKTISFAWDADYLCVPEGDKYTISLAQEIRNDWNRPIVAFVDRNSGAVRGFNLISNDSKIITQFDITCVDGTKKTMQATQGDASWGKNNNRQPLLQQVIIPGLASLCPATDQHVCVEAQNMLNGLRTYHEFCHEL